MGDPALPASLRHVSITRFFHPQRRALYRMALRHGGLGVVPILGTILLLRVFASAHWLAWDFHNFYWIAANKVLHGSSPYLAPMGADLTSFATRSLSTNQGLGLFLYPAPAAVVLAPFALISRWFADWCFTFVCIASVLLALRTLGVRDWRIYGAVLLWPPVISGYQNANLSLPLVLGVAFAWKYRDRPIVTGAILGLSLIHI